METHLKKLFRPKLSTQSSEQFEQSSTQSESCVENQQTSSFLNDYNDAVSKHGVAPLARELKLENAVVGEIVEDVLYEDGVFGSEVTTTFGVVDVANNSLDQHKGGSAGIVPACNGTLTSCNTVVSTTSPGGEKDSANFLAPPLADSLDISPNDLDVRYLTDIVLQNTKVLRFGFACNAVWDDVLALCPELPEEELSEALGVLGWIGVAAGLCKNANNKVREIVPKECVAEKNGGGK